MTREEGLARCEELNHHLTSSGHWFARQTAGNGWEVVLVDVPNFQPTGDHIAVIEAKPRPAQPPDPRPSIIRNIPPLGPS